jgi:hypothetical protein
MDGPYYSDGVDYPCIDSSQGHHFHSRIDSDTGRVVTTGTNPVTGPFRMEIDPNAVYYTHRSNLDFACPNALALPLTQLDDTYNPEYLHTQAHNGSYLDLNEDPMNLPLSQHHARVRISVTSTVQLQTEYNDYLVETPAQFLPTQNVLNNGYIGLENVPESPVAGIPTQPALSQHPVPTHPASPSPAAGVPAQHSASVVHETQHTAAPADLLQLAAPLDSSQPAAPAAQQSQRIPQPPAYPALPAATQNATQHNVARSSQPVEAFDPDTTSFMKLLDLEEDDDALLELLGNMGLDDCKQAAATAVLAQRMEDQHNAEVSRVLAQCPILHVLQLSTSVFLVGWE